MDELTDEEIANEENLGIPEIMVIPGTTEIDLHCDGENDMPLSCILPSIFKQKHLQNGGQTLCWQKREES